MHKKKAQFENRFQQYLSNKLSPEKKQKIFGDQFSTPAHPNRSSNQRSRPSHNGYPSWLVEQSSQGEWGELSNHSSNSNGSFDSSHFKYSNYKTAMKQVSSNRKQTSAPRRRLKKMRELQENECGICLDQIKDKCRLECRHQFCLECVQQWFENCTKCPFCRAEVTQFENRGSVHIVEPVEMEYEYSEVEEIFDWVCYVCNHAEEGQVVLICERCDAAACHVECDQRLGGIMPQGEWYCHSCR